MSRLDSHDQHFLRSPDLVAELIGHSNINKNDLVYDLGAGSGVISASLAKRCAKVVAVELEPVALSKLRDNTADFSNIRIVPADLMTISFGRDQFKIFANPPFSLISELLNRLMLLDNPPVAIYLIVQKQFARKVVPSDHNFTSALGIALASSYSARIRKPLERTDFTPPPAVDTVLLELILLDKPILEKRYRSDYQRFIIKAFADYKFFLDLPRHDVGISSERKASEINPQKWVELYRLVAQIDKN